MRVREGSTAYRILFLCSFKLLNQTINCVTRGGFREGVEPVYALLTDIFSGHICCLLLAKGAHRQVLEGRLPSQYAQICLSGCVRELQKGAIKKGHQITPPLLKNPGSATG